MLELLDVVVYGLNYNRRPLVLFIPSQSPGVPPSSDSDYPSEVIMSFLPSPFSSTECN